MYHTQSVAKFLVPRPVCFLAVFAAVSLQFTLPALVKFLVPLSAIRTFAQPNRRSVRDDDGVFTYVI